MPMQTIIQGIDRAAVVVTLERIDLTCTALSPLSALTSLAHEFRIEVSPLRRQETLCQHLFRPPMPLKKALTGSHSAFNYRPHGLVQEATNKNL